MTYRLIHERGNSIATHEVLLELEDPRALLEELHARALTLSVGKLRVVDQRGRSLAAFYAPATTERSGR